MLSLFIKKYWKSIALILIALLIYCFECNSNWVEQYYYGIMYPKIASLQRGLTGWIPFSIGDILYIIFAVYILVSIFLFAKKMLRKQQKIDIIKKTIIKCINFILLVYIIFKLLWGLNYSRQGIAKQLALEETIYCKEEIVSLLEELIFKANEYRKEIKDTSLPNINIDAVFSITKKGYSDISKDLHFLEINNYSIKASLFSKAGNYFGYTGYYNPFTGEAQIRSDIPKILLPYIACHEVAHQLGYASENEANFIAYLVAEKSDNIYLKYSTCLELIDYALNDLLLKYYEDFDVINGFEKRLQLLDCFDSQVKRDRKSIKLFFLENKKNISAFSNLLYDKYLKINHQNAGIVSYNQVIGLVLAYNHKKKLKNNLVL